MSRLMVVSHLFNLIESLHAYCTSIVVVVSARGVTIVTVSDSVVTLKKKIYLLSNKLFYLEVITCASAIAYCMQSETNVFVHTVL